MKSVDAEADAIVAQLAAKLKACKVRTHPEAALIDALLARKVGDKTIENIMAARHNSVSDQSIARHRRRDCSCPR